MTDARPAPPCRNTATLPFTSGAAHRTFGPGAGVMKLLGGAVAFSLLVACPSWAAIYYVDQGNASAWNGNAGTNPALPWFTLGHACSTAVAGDLVIVKAGTYIDANGTDLHAFNPVNSGTPT